MILGFEELRRDVRGVFDQWVEKLTRAGIEAKHIAIVEYDREHGHNPTPHPRGNEVYVLVPVAGGTGSTICWSMRTTSD
jgi:hypothetical protein